MAWLRRWPAAACLLGLSSAFAAAAGCSSDDRLPRLQAGPPSDTGGTAGTAGDAGPSPHVRPCTSGESRDCHLTLSEHASVLACYHGTETCVDGRWGDCEGGEIDYVDSSQRKPLNQPLAIADAGPCGIENNPCDPSCYWYPEERPDGGYTAAQQGVFSYTGGSIADVPAQLVGKGIVQPCRSAFDCQFDRRCVNPGADSCPHSVCQQGAPLTSGCDSSGTTLGNRPGCVQQICNSDSSCCLSEPTGCTHNVCEVGGPLSSAFCGACVQAICASNPTCCGQNGGKWTQACVDAVSNAAACSAIDCPCPQNSALSPDGRTCHRYFQNPQTWTNARSACTNIGGSLVTIESREENTSILTTIREDSWIGLNDRAVENDWQWTSGAPYNGYPNPEAGMPLTFESWWKPDQPDNSNCEGCVEMVQWSPQSGNWNDQECGTARHYVCEFPAANGWRQDCVQKVKSVCGADCNVANQGTGQCMEWLPGQTDPGCSANFDLTLGIPCDDGVLVCNRGGVAAPGGMPIWYFPTTTQPDSNQFPKQSPNTAYPGAVTHCVTPALAPGECRTVMGCLSDSGPGELMVNPGGTGECNGKNNWSLREAGAVACSSPQVCEQGSLRGGAGAACTYALVNPGNFDPSNSVVRLEPAGTALPASTNATACAGGQGWYFNAAADPSSLTLCSASCSALRASSANRVDIGFGCPMMLSGVAVHHQEYEGWCPAGNAPQWSLMIYDTTVPDGGSVLFEARSAPTREALADVMEWKPLRTATTAEPDCDIGAQQPEGCPIDLFTTFGGIPDARNPWLELRITVAPAPGGVSPTVHYWRLDYSCVANQ
jgi:hypothetical protein